MVTSELNQIKKEREKKSTLKEKRLNRKRSPMTSEIYNQLMKENESPS